MRDNNKYKEESGLEFKEWVDFLHSCNDDLNILNEMARKSFDLGSDNISNFCVSLRVFLSSKKPYIYDQTILDKVQKIQDTLFSNEFRKSLDERKTHALKYQYEALNSLLIQYEKIVKCLSSNGIIPTVTTRIEEKPDEDYLGASV